MGVPIAVELERSVAVSAGQILVFFLAHRADG